MEYILTLTFLCSNNSKSSMTIDGVNKLLTSSEVSALMDTIIEKNIFTNKNGSFVEKSGAQLTQKSVAKYNL